MRPASFVLLLIVPAAALACASDTPVIPVTVQWMDWPAGVVADRPFPVRMVVYWPCAARDFRPGPAADESAVTFTPYFVRMDDNTYCALAQEVVTSLVIGSLDTVGLAPGLAADGARSYEMRAVTAVQAPRSIRTFGDVAVTPPSPVLDPTIIRNAAGFVRLERDTLGCARIRPVGLYAPQATFVLENPVDTAGLSGSFVRGYIRPVGSPVCGESKVFHLVSRN